jgi:hypothetical protein
MPAAGSLIGVILIQGSLRWLQAIFTKYIHASHHSNYECEDCKRQQPGMIADCCAGLPH